MAITDMRHTLTRPNFSTPIVRENRLPVQQFRTFLLQVYQNGLMVGTGSPVLTLEAEQGSLYMDETGIAGAVLFIKQVADDGSGDKTYGWVAIG